MLNKLIEIHTMQRTLPDRILALFIKELDEWNMGGGMNPNRLVDAIEKSNQELKNNLIDYVKKSGIGDRMVGVRNEPNDETTEARCNFTSVFYNHAVGVPNAEGSAGAPIISREHGIWGHFWKGRVNCLPENFVFPSNKTLLSLWHSWHLPDLSNRICPYKSLNAQDVNNVRRGCSKLGEMKLVINALLAQI